MRYSIKRECWNEKTFNGYEDSPYWRVDLPNRSFGLKDNGEYWSIDNSEITVIDVSDIARVIKECNLHIVLKPKQ